MTSERRADGRVVNELRADGRVANELRRTSSELMDATGMAAAQRVANELRADGCNRDGGGTADPQNNHRIMNFGYWLFRK